MSLLDFESSGPGPKAGKKSLKLMLGIGALAGVVTLSSTLAASINLNGGDDVEFGQGVVMTTACDPEITITPFSTFINAQGGGEHRLSSIRLSGIDSSEGACEGKTFRIRAYGDGPDPLDLFKWEDGLSNGSDDNGVWDESDYDWTERDSYDFVDINRTDSDFIWTSDGTDNDDVINVDDETNIEQTAFTLSFVSVAEAIRRTPLVSTDVLKKITVETFDATQSVGAYNIGDIGPGGGIVFYVASTPFDCGPTLTSSCTYLEVAPDGWNGDTGDNTGFPWALQGYEEVDVPSVLNVDRVYDSTGIGLGYQNSVAIRDQGNSQNVAATLALGYVNPLTDIEDWYLPSVDELDILCRWNLGLNPLEIADCNGGTPNSPTYFAQFSGLIADSFYWSSTEPESTSHVAWVRAMRPGENGGTGSKASNFFAVRPIRAF